MTRRDLVVATSGAGSETRAFSTADPESELELELVSIGGVPSSICEAISTSRGRHPTWITRVIDSPCEGMAGFATAIGRFVGRGK